MGVTVLVSSKHDDKWMANGQFRLQNDHFPRKDWGEFQLHLKALEQQKRSLQMAGVKHRHLRSRNVMCSMRCVVQNKEITLVVLKKMHIFK